MSDTEPGSFMSPSSIAPLSDHQAESFSLPAETAKEMRRLLHDMNNSLEIIIQASYLVSTLDLPETGRQWMQLLESGVNQNAAHNRELRALIQKATEPEER